MNNQDYDRGYKDGRARANARLYQPDTTGNADYDHGVRVGFWVAKQERINAYLAAKK